MSAIADDRKVALLLSAIGDEAVEAALSKLSDEKARSIRQAINDFQDDPPSDQEREAVLDDFERFFRFALESANLPSSWMHDLLDENSQLRGDAAGATNPGQADDDWDDDSSDSAQTPLKIFEPTDDAFHDLNRLKPVQLACALHAEQPKTIALVLRQISSKRTAEVIRYLPENSRTAVILELRKETKVPHFLVERIVQETVNMASGASNTISAEEDINDQIAGMLRRMPKKERTRIMADMRDRDPDAAEMIASRLYIFEDITTFDDRSVQKLLAEVETGVLVAALRGADETIKDAVLNNLSKRGRAAILEEMELTPNLSEDDVSQARSQIATVIASLDQEGRLSTR